MRFEIEWRHPGKHVVGDPGYPKLFIYYRSRQYPEADLALWSFQRVWCGIVGHRFGEWQQEKFVPGRSRQCTRCGRFDQDPSTKRPRLFYWEDAEDAWCPAETLAVENIIDVGHFFADGDELKIRFKRQDMTDAEFAAIPEG